MNGKITKIHESLATHSLYNKLDSLENIKIFMKYHVFAVWDFMSLLKSLQREITTVTLPWNDSQYDPQLVRLINEIVLGEESDVGFDGKPASHFSLYLAAMDEIGADSSLIKTFVNERDFSLLPDVIEDAVSYHLELASHGEVYEVASSFFYGREKLLPDVFESIVHVLEAHNLNCPKLIYYFKRHIELDGENHGPKAMICLNKLTDSNIKRERSLEVALSSLKKRELLWDFIESEILHQ